MFILGVLLGVGVAAVFRIATDETAVTGDSFVDKLRLQARQAKLEGDLAAKEKEAELLREYDAAVHRPIKP